MTKAVQASDRRRELIILLLPVHGLRKLMLYPTELRGHSAPCIFYLSLAVTPILPTIHAHSSSFTQIHEWTMGKTWVKRFSISIVHTFFRRLLGQGMALLYSDLTHPTDGLTARDSFKEKSQHKTHLIGDEYGKYRTRIRL